MPDRLSTEFSVASKHGGLRGRHHKSRRDAQLQHRLELLFGRWMRRAGFAAVLFSGCIWGDKKELTYLGEADLQHYKAVATEVAYPNVFQPVAEEAKFAERPRYVGTREKDEVWDLKLDEVLHTALVNNSIIRTGSASGASSILNNPNQVASVYDPAIQESGVLFGGRGLEAALAAFDAQWTTSMVWGRNEQPLNNAFTGSGVTAGNALVQETGNFSTQLGKQFGYGGQLSLNHNWNYNGTNAPSLFSSAYTGTLQAQYRHPLLAGAGPEFTRIAGPITQSFGGITGVNQGVTIARINNDLTIADFEASVLQLLKDVEDVYWDLYLSYRAYDTTVTARNSALRSWTEAKIILDAGGRAGFRPADEAQARDFYYQARAAAQTSLASVYATETRLRRVMGLPVNDGRIIRPANEPITAEFVPDWYISLTEALTKRVELRRQKWSIKSLELQLTAANSLTRPRLDFVSGYQINALGDRLLGSNSSGPNNGNFATGYGSLTQGDHTGWGLGFEMNMPLGFRSAHAQVRNIELRLAKAREVLSAQELEISHELAASVQSLAAQYETAKSNFNRYLAAQQRVELFDAEVRIGTKTLDELLRAQASRAEAEVAYFRSLIEYNKAITGLHYSKGTLLEHNNVYLAESDWTADAYVDALRRAWARSHAFDADHVEAQPAEFVYPGILYDSELPNDSSMQPAGYEEHGQQRLDIMTPIEKTPVPGVPEPEPEILPPPTPTSSAG